jgi:PAS domain S-box-containing protein
VSRALDESPLEGGALVADRVLDLAQAIVLVLDARGRIFFNRFLEELSGFALDQVRGRDWFSTFIAPGDRRQVRDVFRETERSGRTGFRNAILTKGGAPRLVEWRNCLLAGPDARRAGVLAVGQDVTEERQVEDLRQRSVGGEVSRSLTASVPGAAEIEAWKEAQALRRAEDRWRELVESVPDAMVLVSEEGRIQLVNAQAERLFGYERHELLGQSVEILVPERLRADHVGHRAGFLSRPRARSMGSGLDLVGRRRDGSEVPIEVSLSLPIPTPAGLMVSAAIRDASERRQSERRLRRARVAAERASASKSRFLATASHDLRQPLQAASLYLSVLSAELGDEQPRSLDKLSACLDALGGLVGKLFDISKLESGRVTVARETVELAPLLERLADEARPVAEGKGLELRVARTTVTLFTDPERLAQILQNLLFNAVRYTDRGRILLGCRRHGSCMRIQVWDTGCGIPEDDLERIFEDFYRVAGSEGSGDGLGLGLAIVARLSRLLDHPVAVVSRLGRGSCFAVSVPLDAAAGHESAAAGSVKGEARMGVLAVLEPDPHVLDAMRLSLQLAGHRVVAGSSVESVLARLTEEGITPNVVLAELRLGADGCGIAAVQRIRAELGADIAGVLFTVDTSRSLAARAAAGGLEILHKPVAAQELEDVLLRCLAGRRAAGE